MPPIFLFRCCGPPPISSARSRSSLSVDSGLWVSSFVRVASSFVTRSSLASISFENGTSVPIAQVYGPPGYKAFMRGKTVPAPTENGTLCRLLSPALDVLPSVSGLNVDACHNSDVISMKALLATLNSAVEAYLGTNICYAELSMDDAEGHKKSVAEEALRAIGLRQVHSTRRANPVAAVALTADSISEYDLEERVVLAIDYSSRWFSVGLYTIEEGILEHIEDTMIGPRIDQDNQLGALKDTLESLVVSPPPNAHRPKQIHHLVVYGDDSKSEVLWDLLATIFDADLVRDAHVSSSVFDVVNYAAHGAYEAMYAFSCVPKEQPAAPGCRRRSKFYGEDPIEL